MYLSVMSINVSWHAVSTRLRRAGAQYVRIKVGDEYAVLHTELLPGSVLIPQGMAQGVLKAAIEAVVHDRRPVSTSRGWAMPKEGVVESEWERVSGMPVAPIEALPLVNGRYDVLGMSDGFMVRLEDRSEDTLQGLLYWLRGDWAREIHDRGGIR